MSESEKTRKNQPFFARFKFAVSGIFFAWRAERSFRTQTIFAAGAVTLLAFFRPAPVWWALFFLVIAAVLSLELVNTALELLVDRLHPEIHPTIGLAKDCAAGAVLVASFGALTVLAAFFTSLLSPGR